VLYLAEVQKNRRGMMGGGKPEFRLLACQRTEQSWSAVPGEEVIPAPEDANNYAAGVLVMVELSANKQVQRHSEAGRQLVSILQGFSRLQEKAKTQEAEIEQWKESLTYQSQELNRRELELEARQEELQQLEGEFTQFDTQRQEIDAARTEVEQLREEFERKTEELQGAWAQLRGETNRLEERQAELSGGLDANQANHLRELIDRLAAANTATAFNQQVNAAFEQLNQQQRLLDSYWHPLQEQQNTAQQLQGKVDWKTQELRDRWYAWHQAQTTLEQAKADLSAQQASLSLNREYAKVLRDRLQAQEVVQQQLSLMTSTSSKVDLGALESLSIDALQSVVSDLEKDLEKLSRFVSSQEEELTLQQDAINDLQHQIQQASEYDRLRLETELADEQDRYQMLNETLVGQRRNLQERQTGLKQHQAVLARRQGYPVQDEDRSGLEPILIQFDQWQQQQRQEQQALEENIQQIQATLPQLEAAVTQQISEQEAKREELRQLEQQVQAQVVTTAELWGKVNTQQELLQPIQDNLNGVRHQLEAIAAALNPNGDQSSEGGQAQVLDEIRSLVQQLAGG
jgi:chromosome segregation ATPase